MVLEGHRQRRRRWWSPAAALLAALPLFLVLGGCTQTSTGPDEPDAPVIADSVYVPEIDGPVQLYAMDGDEFTLSYTGDRPPVEVGTIIVIPDSTGYLRRVTSVRDTVRGRESYLILGTDFAPLSEAILEGRLEATIPVDTRRMQRKPGGPSGVRLDVRRDRIDISGTIYEGEIGGVVVEVSARQGSHIAYGPDLEIDCEFDHGISEFSIALVGGIDTDVIIDATVSDALEDTHEHTTIPGYQSPPAIVGWVGTVPVIATLDLDFEVGFDAELGCETDVSWGCSGDYQATAGALYERGRGWSRLWEQSASFGVHDPGWSAGCECGVRGYVKPVLGVKLYDVAGSCLATEPYVRFAGETEARPAYSWGLYGGLTAAVGVAVEVLDHSLPDCDITFNEWETEIASDSWSSDSGTIVVETSPDSIHAAWSLSGPQSESGSGDTTLTEMPVGSYTISWQPVGGYVTPDGGEQDLGAGATITFEGDYVSQEPEAPHMLEVPAGQFEMGDPDAQCADVHTVILTRNFQIGRDEVTNREYARALQWALNHEPPLVTATASSVEDALDGSTEELLDLNSPHCRISFSEGLFTVDAGYEDHPVVEVTWFGAARYCDWLSAASGVVRAYQHSGSWVCNGHHPYDAVGYRLPTDAEWEYAAQYPDGRIYPWGVDSPTCVLANHSGCEGSTLPVGSCSPAGDASLGFRDMAGNAFEWCNDRYVCQLGPYQETDPVGTTFATYFVRRGGAWYTGSVLLRCADRVDMLPHYSDSGTGFRVARSAP